MILAQGHALGSTRKNGRLMSAAMVPNIVGPDSVAILQRNLALGGKCGTVDVETAPTPLVVVVHARAAAG